MIHNVCGSQSVASVSLYLKTVCCFCIIWRIMVIVGRRAISFISVGLQKKNCGRGGGGNSY